MDLWQNVRRAVESKDLALARALGFDNCQQCGEWFRLAGEDWRDCTSCGRHCPACAEAVAWQWCADCGHYTCLNCAGDGLSPDCPVCQIASG
ncbi:MAG: hypothetical protein PVH18_07155 [Chloroflexota bacterium]|jgi:hypothetical protein